MCRYPVPPVLSLCLSVRDSNCLCWQGSPRHRRAMARSWARWSHSSTACGAKCTPSTPRLCSSRASATTDRAQVSQSGLPGQSDRHVCRTWQGASLSVGPGRELVCRTWQGVSLSDLAGSQSVCRTWQGVRLSVGPGRELVCLPDLEGS